MPSLILNESTSIAWQMALKQTFQLFLKALKAINSPLPNHSLLVLLKNVYWYDFKSFLEKFNLTFYTIMCII